MKLLIKGEIREVAAEYGMRLVEQGMAAFAPARDEPEEVPAVTGETPERTEEEAKPKSRSRKKTGKVNASEPEG